MDSGREGKPDTEKPKGQLPSYHLTTTANPLRTQPHSQSESVHNSGYIVVRHGSNTWTKMSDGDEADNFFRADGPYIRNRSRPSYIQTTIVSIIRCGRSFSERRFCRKPGRQRGVRVLPDAQLG